MSRAERLDTLAPCAFATRFIETGVGVRQSPEPIRWTPTPKVTANLNPVFRYLTKSSLGIAAPV